MSEVMIISGANVRKVLETIVAQRPVAIMSYLTDGKWRSTKVIPDKICDNLLYFEIDTSVQKQPLNVRSEQVVGISIKYHYDKFIFDSVVNSLESSLQGTCGGTIVMVMPEVMEQVPQRSYFRVKVPGCLAVDVKFWHRSYTDPDMPVFPIEGRHYWHGKLVDLSAGGAQIAISENDADNFRAGQFIGLNLTPLPTEGALTLNAQIRNILPTAGGEYFCLGIQLIGLEATSQGRSALSRLANIVERYHQINQAIRPK